MIQDGDFIILQREDTMRVFQAKKNGRPIYFERMKFQLDNIFGKPYGSRFEVDKTSHQLMLVTNDFCVEKTDLQVTSGADNRNLLSLNEESQTLNKDSIKTLKQEGLSGQEVMTELIKNSSTFNQKTKFSQEKWIKKKKKRHLSEFTVLKLCTRWIAEMYHKRDPAGICYLRMDTLAQILTLGNVHASSKILLVETCQGLLAGAILQRLSDDGKLVQLFTNANPMKKRSAFDDFGYSKDLQRTRLKLYPLNLLHELSMFAPSDQVEKKTSYPEGVEQPAPKRTREDPDDKVHVNLSNASVTGGDCGRADVKIPVHIQERLSSKHYLQSNKFDALIIAVKYSPTQLVLRLLDLLKLSRPIVIYHQHKEPLMEVFVQLKERGGLLNMQLTETWYREIQVLPDRTHPTVNMSGTGGYLLTATTVER